MRVNSFMDRNIRRQPISLYPDDDYLVNGVVVQVIKKPLQD